MTPFRAYGYDWIARSDSIGPVPLSPSLVTRYNQSAPIPGLTTQRVGLSAASGSSCVMLKDALGFGKYEVIIAGRMDTVDPSIVPAVWTNDDWKPDPDGVEADFEVMRGSGDPNDVNNAKIGVLVGKVKTRFGEWIQKPLPPLLYHRVTMLIEPGGTHITASGLRDGKWLVYVSGSWHVNTPRPTRFKVGMLRLFGADRYPASVNGPARIVVCGFSFTPG